MKRLPLLVLASVMAPAFLLAQSEYRWETIGPDGGIGVWRIFSDFSGAIYVDLQKAIRSERSTPVYRLDPGDTIWRSLPMYDTAWRGDHNGPMVVPFKEGLIGLDGCCGIVYSDDGGRTWSGRGTIKPPNPVFEPFQPEIAVVSDTIVLFPASQSFADYWVSGDGGYSWENRSANDVLLVNSFYSTGSDLFALTKDGLKRYVGSEWIEIGPTTSSLLSGTIAAYGDTLLLSTSPAGDDRMSISFDLGSTWQVVSGRLGALTWGDGAFWGARGDSIFVFDLPSLTWDYVTKTPDGEQVLSLYVEDSIRYAGTTDGLIRWRDELSPELFQSGLAGHVTEYLAWDGVTLYASTSDTALYGTSEGATVWTRRDFPQIGNPVGLAYGAGGLYTADRGSSRIWYSIDSGVSWKTHSFAQAGVSSISTLYGGGQFVTVGAGQYMLGKYHDTLSWRSYMFGSGAEVLRLGELGGNPVALVREPAKWSFLRLDQKTMIPSLSFPPIISLDQTPLLATSGSSAYIAVNGEGLYVSRDTGATWILLDSIPGPIPGAPIDLFDFVFAHDSFVLIVGRHAEMNGSLINQYAVSYDEGRSWRLIPRASNAVSDAIVVDGNLYLTSYRRSVVAGRSVLSVPDNPHSREELDRNGTVLSFFDGILSIELRRSMDYEITLYDVGGNQIADIAKGIMTAGIVRIPVSLDGLSTGVYFVRLAGSDGSEQFAILPLVR